MFDILRPPSWVRHLEFYYFSEVPDTIENKSKNKMDCKLALVLIIKTTTLYRGKKATDSVPAFALNDIFTCITLLGI